MRTKLSLALGILLLTACNGPDNSSPLSVQQTAPTTAAVQSDTCDNFNADGTALFFEELL